MMTASEAKKAGMVWATIKFSGGPETPLLGDCEMGSKGPMDPETSFLIWMLVKGLTVEEAQSELAKVRAKVVKAKKKAVASK